jgi:hypothetical protein
MVKYRSINDTLLGFGFDWKTANKDVIQKVIKEECTKNGDKYSYIIPQNDTDVLYTTSEDSDSMSTIPAAHIVFETLGKEEEDLIYFYKINEDYAWVCCIYKNQIISGGDLTISIQNLDEELIKLAELLGSDDLNGFSIYADENAITIFENQDVNYQVELSDISEQFKNEVKRKGFNNVFSNKEMLSKIGVISVVALCLMYYLMNDTVTSVTSSEQNLPRQVNTEKLLRQLPKSEKRDADELLDKSITKSDDVILRDARKQELVWLNDEINLIHEPEFLNEIYNRIIYTHSTISGWKLRKVTYDISAPKNIEYLYAKTSNGTALTLKKSIEGKPFILAPHGQSAIVYESIDTFSTESSKVNFNDLAKLDFSTIELMHSLDISRTQWSMRLLPNEERLQTIEGLKDSSRENERQLRTDSREVILKGKYLSDFEKIVPIFTQTDKFILERIVLDVDRSVSWSLYGVYHNNFAQ